MDKIRKLGDQRFEESDKIAELATQMYNLVCDKGYFKAVQTSQYQQLSEEINNCYREKSRLLLEFTKAKIEKEIQTAEQHSAEGSDYFSTICFNNAERMADNIWYDDKLRSEMYGLISQRKRHLRRY